MLLVTLLLAGCSEERKQEAAKLAGQLQAQEKGETLKTSADSTAPTQAGDSSGASAAHESASRDNVPPVTQQQAEPAVSSPAKVRPADTTRSMAQAQTGMPPHVTEGFTVQVESSPSQAYIDSQVVVYRGQGYDAYAGSVTVNDRTYYRLRVGKYTAKRVADSVSGELNGRFGLKTWVDQQAW